MPKLHQKKTDMYRVRKQKKIQDLFNPASLRVVPTIHFEWGLLSMEECPSITVPSLKPTSFTMAKPKHKTDNNNAPVLYTRKPTPQPLH